MNGATNCPECGSRMAIKATNHGAGLTFRIAECDCGERWELEERRARRLPPCTAVHSRGQSGTPLGDRGPPPTAASPLPSGGGFGGPLSEVSESDQDSGPTSPANPERGRAKSNADAIDYPAEYLLVWTETGKHGAKALGHKAWVKAGRPTWVSLRAPWHAYLLSERPMAGFVKDLSSWLNAKCHQQEWEPATVKPIRQLESFAVRAEREREERLLDERAESLFGTGANR